MRMILSSVIAALACAGAAFAQPGLPSPSAQSGHMQVPFANVGPTIATCGTGAVLRGSSTDSFGAVLMGPDANTCTITFAIPFLAQPDCDVVNRLGTVTWVTTTTGIAVSATPASSALHWRCYGR